MAGVPTPTALKVTGLRPTTPATDTLTVFFPILGPSVSVLCALPFASVIAFSSVNLPLNLPWPEAIINVTRAPCKGLPY